MHSFHPYQKIAILVYLVLVCVSSFSQSNTYDIAPWYQWKTAAVVLTFDDWSLDHPDNAIPEMNTYDIKGTFFINGWAFIEPAKLENAIFNGHEIANHTGLHFKLTELTPEERNTQITGFQNEINTRLPNQRCITFSYLFGEGAGVEEVESIVRATHIGARAVINQIWPYNFGGADYYRLPAMTIRNTTTLNDLKGWLNDAVTKKGLAIIMYHGVTGGPSDISIPFDQFQAHMQELNDRKSTMWIATFRDMIKYHLQAEQAQLISTSQSNTQLQYSLTDNLPDDIYNHPLSIRILLPADFEIEQIKQGEQQLTYNIEGNYVYFEAIPDAGIISISNSNQNPGKLTQQISFNPIPDKKTTDPGFTINATATSGLGVDFVLESGPATLEDNTVTLKGKAGTVRIKATQAGDDQYLPAEEVIREFVVRRVPQEIIFNSLSDKSVLDKPFILNASSSSGLPVVLSVVSGPASLNGNELTLDGNPGTVTIEASQAGNDTYLAAIAVKRSFEVQKAGQTIVMATIPDKSVNDDPFDIAVNSTSDLPVSLEVLEGPATLAGNTCTLTGQAGKVVIRATQAGNNQYLAAEPETKNFNVNKLTQQISFPAISDKKIDDTPFDISATSTSGLPISFSVLSGPASIQGSRISLDGTLGTVVVEATQAGNDQYAPASPFSRSFSVGKASQTLTFPQISEKRADSKPFQVSASASSGLPVTIEVVQGPAKMEANTCILNGIAGKVTLRVRQQGNDQYLPAQNITQSFIVSKVPQIITFPVIPTQKTTNAPFELKATASSGLLVLYDILSGPAFLNGNIVTLSGDTGTVVIEASQAGSATYFEAEKIQQSFEVISNIQTIRFDTLPDILLDAPPFSLNASASSNLPISFQVLEGPATIKGDTCYLEGKAGIISIEARQDGNTDFEAAIPVIRTFEVKKLPHSISIDPVDEIFTTDPPFQLNFSSSADLPVSFEIMSGPASRIGDTITLDKVAGTVEVRATQPGNEIFETANDMLFTFEVLKTPQIIQFDSIPGQFLEQDSIILSAKSNSGFPVAFQMEKGPAYIRDNVIYFTGFEGMITVTTLQEGNETYLPAENVSRSFEVVKRSQLTSTGPALPRPPVRIYPNPVRDILWVEIPGHFQYPLTCEILSLQGSSIRIQTLQQPNTGRRFNIHTNELTPGSYIVQIYTRQGEQYHTMVVKTRN